MKLVEFSAKNYRSISTAYKLPLSDYTVIVGPNNEGKSNILKALGLALSLLTGSKNRLYRRPGIMSYSNRNIERFDYDWERDFPINLQPKDPSGNSEFSCEFELTDIEHEEFKQLIKVNSNSATLKVKISINYENKINYDFLVNEKVKKLLNTKRNEIIKFINNKLLIQYIPTIRTSELAITIIENLLERELSTLEDNPEFKKIIKMITKLQQPIINKITKNLKDSITGFIPDVKDISIKNRDNVGRLISASCRVYIDDGIETDLQLKGDGVISLTAISLLQHFSKQGSLNKALILLLEEPESHLHPKAIHNLKSVLHDISKTNQVIVTTHSPIIVERQQIKHNIIVQDGKADLANNIATIRQSLGITMSDNLLNAYLVLLVEGIEDIELLKVWLEEKSMKIKSAFSNSTLIIDHLGGATNVGYKTSFYKNALCNVIVFIDNDEAGRRGVNDAEVQGILKTSEYFLSVCRGMKNSEVEDLIHFNSYRQLIIDEYGIDLKAPIFKNNKKQWSDRVKEMFMQSGKLWNKNLEMNIKYKVIKQAVNQKLLSLNKTKENSIEALVSAIEMVLDKK